MEDRRQRTRARRRLKKTLADVMVIGISPALIMTLVGSLVFFLLVVFYRGQFETRLMFIFAMFVMAIVLIARISMEEGIEYATLFAIPLAIVTELAMIRFVRIEGPLAGLSLLINTALLALVWWCAHKLTWDCTLIDEQEDASGEGLLQNMGFDAETVEDQARSTPAEPGARQDQSTAGQSDLRDWWQRFVERRRRAHTPGVWVVYFSLGALPLFGVGQWFIPSSELAIRRFAFQLLCIYVASALGLLLTTSFLGLRRYLRQRRLQMPMDMAGLWLGIGVAMIVALLAVCVLLPRPGAVASISQLPFQFSSPDHSRTSRWAVGNDGPETAQATRTRPGAKSTSENSPSSPSPSKKSGTSGKSASGKSGSQGKQRGGQKGTSKSGQTSRRPSSQQGSQTGKSGASGQQADKRQGSSQDGRDGQQSQRGESGGREQKRSDSNDQQSAKSGGKQSGTSKSGRSAPDKEGQKNAQGSPSGDDKSGQGRSSRTSARDQRADESKARQPNKQSAQRSGGPNFETNRSPSSQPPRPASKPSSASQGGPEGRAWSPGRALEQIAGAFGILMKLLFFITLLGVVAFVVWKYREQIRKALKQLIDDLKELWARLFGGGRQAESAEVDLDDGIHAPSGRPFASYRNPFATGASQAYTIEQLVCYSFEALEAWARERECGRQEEQTPLEFGRQVARRCPELAQEVQILADLYSRVVYGHLKVSARRENDVQRLWQELQAARPAGALP